MSTPLTKGFPVWLATRDPYDPLLNKHYKRSVLYYTALYKAWPDWCAVDLEFASIYAYSKALRKLGYKSHVDHIVPIISPIVCGLHVPWNLQVISEAVNLSKSNHIWPDHPFETLDMFSNE